MNHSLSFTKIGTVAIAAFIPWIIILAGLSASMGFPRPAFIAVHYLMDVALFAIAFTIYFRGHTKEDPFTIMALAMGSLLVFEIVYFNFFYEGELWFLTYADWLVPVFLIATTIYWVGRVMK